MANDLTLRREALPADKDPGLVYLAGLPSPHSRRTMGNALATIAGILTNTREEYRGRLVFKNDAGLIPWSELRFQHVNLIRSVLADEYSPVTANKMLAALRGVLKACWRLDLIPDAEYRKAVDFEPVKGETLPAGRDVSIGEITALMSACAADPGPAGVRDAAIIGLMYSCGLRRAEVAALDLADFDQDAGTLAVRGKGKRDRIAHVVNGAYDALLDWLDLRDGDPGPLFLPIRKGGHVKHFEGGLTAQALYKMLRKRCEQAGVNNVSPHDFRRSFVGDLLDAGADMVTVQKLAGHADPSTTSRYDRRGEETKRNAALLLHIPYKRRS